MFRFRRYRVFVAFALFTLFLIYSFGGSRNWVPPTAPIADKSQSDAHPEKVDTAKGDARPDSPPAHQDTARPTQKAPPAELPVPKTVERPAATPPAAPLSLKDQYRFIPTPAPGSRVIPSPAQPVDYIHGVGGQGRVEVDDVPSALPIIRWSPIPEHFPVESTIQLPRGTPKSITKIQHHFKAETPKEKAAREEKLAAIKAAAKHSWDGYREYAFGKDEVSPVSGNYRNPFNGWGATLVDALDTLWIMGMKEEFEEAVEAVGKVDFQTSARNDIPVFEVTIRYLGGMLAAYDISGGKYKILLDKAVELAEVLFGMFDTPNRMPVTYYQWKPAFASQPHKAGASVVLAEIGSLSVEFTRLAQITKEPKYYDAIDRITDAFKGWQKNTRLPGMFPDRVDASGCNYPLAESTNDNENGQGSRLEMLKTGTSIEEASEEISLKKPEPWRFATEDGAKKDEEVPVKKPEPLEFKVEKEDDKEIPLQKPKPLEFQVEKGKEESSSTKSKPLVAPEKGGKAGRIQGWDKTDEATEEEALLKKPEPLVFKPEAGGKAGRIQGWDEKSDEKIPPSSTQPRDSNIKKRSSADMNQVVALGAENAERQRQHPHLVLEDPAVPPPEPTCTSPTLGSVSDYGTETFTLGGMADSMYEYLPKMYLLLGGLEEKYRSMYEMTADVAIKKLIYRPMTPDNLDILLSGSVSVTGKAGVANPEDVGTAKLTASGSHLTCFVGGMFAMGAKVFNRKEDLDIAAKLTDGCVWAYNATTTGIMPEGFNALPCSRDSPCKWNETRWMEAIDPFYVNRMASYDRQVAQISKNAVESLMAKATASLEPSPALAVAEATQTPKPKPDLPVIKQKRQLDEALHPHETTPLRTTPTIKLVVESPKVYDDSKPDGPEPTYEWETVGEKEPEEEDDTIVYIPPPPLGHEEYVKSRIEEERLPLGMTNIGARKYILRPEAIESVFYMHRITGDPHWREAGWKMWQAIDRVTRAQHGYSAILDVTAKAPTQLDEEESFWLAETLKYFYLLFSEESVVSLDEWVLNTEAHPFRRPS